MNIQHDTTRHRFSVALPEGEAELEYAERDARTLDFLHTQVPAGEQGQGVGAALVEHALTYARREGKRVIPSCPYVQHWLGEHPDFQDVVAPR